MYFATQYEAILRQLHQVDPVAYGKTRNFIDGAVTYLSPYISRGVLTLPQVRDAVLQRGYRLRQIEKFLQELAWREFFQRVWWHKGDAIFSDLKQPQTDVRHHRVPTALLQAKTGIAALDAAIETLVATGYMHNHARMYVAGITCNLAKAHWWQPSRWMYYHLLDGDLASNSCSWQWVAGAFSSKKYIANQENINRYLHSKQHNTYLDRSYDTIFDQPIPKELQEVTTPALHTVLPAVHTLQLDTALPVHLYSSYWLNPQWRSNQAANRILLLEPAHFEKFPVSEKVLQFILALAQNLIPGIQVYCGNFDTLPLQPQQKVYFMEQPLHRHWKGVADPYPWMFPQVQGYHGSFFSYWKKAERYL